MTPKPSETPAIPMWPIPPRFGGSPIIRNDLKFLANYGGNLSENTRFYGYANYASKEVEGGFFFRNPNTRGGVFSTDGGKTLLVGKLNPSAPDPPVVNIIDDVADPNALQQVLSNKNDYFTFRELFPAVLLPDLAAPPPIMLFSQGLKAQNLTRSGPGTSALITEGMKLIS